MSSDINSLHTFIVDGICRIRRIHSCEKGPLSGIIIDVLRTRVCVPAPDSAA